MVDGRRRSGRWLVARPAWPAPMTTVWVVGTGGSWGSGGRPGATRPASGTAGQPASTVDGDGHTVGQDVEHGGARPGLLDQSRQLRSEASPSQPRRTPGSAGSRCGRRRRARGCRCRSMSPSTVDSTDVRGCTPRAAAMLTRPAVRQAARAWRRNSTGVGPWSLPDEHGRVVGVEGERRLWVISCRRRRSRGSSLRLWVPLTQRLMARNWKSAISCWPLTTSRVANRVAVSTPLRAGWAR